MLYFRIGVNEIRAACAGSLGCVGSREHRAKRAVADNMVVYCQDASVSAAARPPGARKEDVPRDVRRAPRRAGNCVERSHRPTSKASNSSHKKRSSRSAPFPTQAGWFPSFGELVQLILQLMVYSDTNERGHPSRLNSDLRQPLLHSLYALRRTHPGSPWGPTATSPVSPLCRWRSERKGYAM